MNRVSREQLIKISETIRDHLIKQAAQSIDEGTNDCCYRDAQGLQCAAGCLIDDAHYDARFEGRGVTHFRSEGVVYPNPNPAILKSLTDRGMIHPDLDSSEKLRVLKLVREWQIYHDSVETGEHAPTKAYAVWVKTKAPAQHPAQFHELLLRDPWLELNLDLVGSLSADQEGEPHGDN